MTSSQAPSGQHKPLSVDEGISVLLKLMFSGALGSAEGKAVSYSVLEEKEDCFVFIAALEDFDEIGVPVRRFRITIDRESGKVDPPETVSLSPTELADVVQSATGNELIDFARFIDGALSISYKVSVKNYPDIQYIVQLRHHGKVASMNALMQLISSTIPPQILPLPAVYPIANEAERQNIIGMGIQITRYIPGIMANSIYPHMTYEQRLQLIRNLGKAYNTLWKMSLPTERMIGELVATNHDGTITLSVGPDRHHSLGGPFSSVADYLRAHVRGGLRALQKQQCIEEYKSLYLQRISNFVDSGMLNIPSIVEQIPVVVNHSDMGLHNVIVSEQDPTDVQAIIDWEFCSAAPYASLDNIIENLFRKPSPNGFGPEYLRADELRQAFWGVMPKWQVWNKKSATAVFREWFRFATFLKPEYRPPTLEGKEKENFWAENVRIVEGFLAKYGQ